MKCGNQQETSTHSNTLHYPSSPFGEATERKNSTEINIIQFRLFILITIYDYLYVEIDEYFIVFNNIISFRKSFDLMN